MASGANDRATVLVVEDDQSVLELIRLVLIRTGVRAFIAESAMEAAAIANEAHIDLLVTDVVLPGASGVELAALLRAERPSLRVLFITGWADPSELNDLADGMLLRKPFDVRDLERAVATALGT